MELHQFYVLLDNLSLYIRFFAFLSTSELGYALHAKLLTPQFINNYSHPG